MGRLSRRHGFARGRKRFHTSFSSTPTLRRRPPELDKYASFVEAYFDVVKDHGLEEFVGLRRLCGYESTGMLESTEGKVNIMFSSNEVCLFVIHNGIPLYLLSQIPPEKLEDGTDTMWFFNGGPPYRMYRCRCTNTGSNPNPNHNHIDQP